MLSKSCANPATRRLVVQYYLVALASSLSGLMLVGWFQVQGSLDDHLAFAVAAELSILVIGLAVIRRSMSTLHDIEHQLLGVVTPNRPDGELQPLAVAGSLAQGWNQVVEQLQNYRAAMSLESHLADLHNAANEKQWDTFFHAIPEGIALCDCQEKIQSSNNSLVTLLGVASTDQILGRSVADLLVEHFPAEQPKLSMSFHTSQRAPLNIELRRGSQAIDGVIRVSRVPLSNPQGDYQGCLWCFRDVTQQRIADECRNQFVFTATHELRTPLANIKAYADTLAEAEDIDLNDQRRFYNIISSEATRLARFVDELLNVSQLESGTALASRGETDIERLVQETIENLSPQLLQKELCFESRLAPKLPTMMVDKDKLNAALVNLLGNAIKYTPEKGSVRLLVEQDDTSLHFHVEDTGIGISAEELPRISEKFFRSQDRRVQALVGSGLGLAYAQEVARLHGGKLSVKSQLNKGSRFSLSIPLT